MSHFSSYSDDGLRTVSEHQTVSRTTENLTSARIVWHMTIMQTGVDEGAQKSSSDGLNLEIDVLKNI